MNERRCASCGALFYRKIPGQREGTMAWQCRRHPPQIVILPKRVIAGSTTISVDALWPVLPLDPDDAKKVDPDIGCVDWVPAIELLS